MYKVSFLIPVYNAGLFIGNCLEHILMSELRQEEFQIITWDDGSTDNSLEILQEYAAKYPNIVVKHAINRGVAAVRKDLFSLAEGEYIWQCDADDYIETVNIKKIVDYAIDNKVDYCSFDYYSFDDSGNKRKQSLKFRDQIFTSFLWNRLFRTDFLREHNISFKGDLYTGDDYIFNCLVRFYAHKNKHFNLYGYNYNYNPNSLTRDKSKIVKDIRSMMHCIDYLIEEFGKCESAKDRKYWKKEIFMNFSVVAWMSYSLELNECNQMFEDLHSKAIRFYGANSIYATLFAKNKYFNKAFLFYYMLCAKLNRLYIKLR